MNMCPPPPIMEFATPLAVLLLNSYTLGLYVLRISVLRRLFSVIVFPLSSYICSYIYGDILIGKMHIFLKISPKQLLPFSLRFKPSFIRKYDKAKRYGESFYSVAFGLMQKGIYAKYLYLFLANPVNPALYIPQNTTESIAIIF